MPGKVLRDRAHAGIAHAVDVGHRQITHHRGTAVEGAIADDLGQAVVQVDAGRKGKIEAAGQQLRSHQPAMAACEIQSGGGIEIELVADEAQRRQRRETVAEALYPPALMVDRHQEAWAAQRVDLLHQALQLRRIGVVARKQDDAAHQRMRQQFAIFRAQLRTGEIDHQWTQSHVVPPAGLSAAVPGGASRAMDSRCVVCGNMSATPAASRSKPSSLTRMPRSRARLPGWQET